MWGYVPGYDNRIKWKYLSNGAIIGEDLGATYDVYTSDVIFEGTQSDMVLLDVNIFGANRETHELTCGVGEEIFGPEVDYSSPLDVVATQVGEIERVSFGLYHMRINFRGIALTTTGTASLATLRPSKWAWEKGPVRDIGVHFTYTSTALYTDRNADIHLFRAEFTQTSAEYQAIRRYFNVTARAATFVFPSIGGISEPFGPAIGSGSQNCKLLKHQCLGRDNLIDWRFRAEFVRIP